MTRDLPDPRNYQSWLEYYADLWLKEGAQRLDKESRETRLLATKALIATQVRERLGDTPTPIVHSGIVGTEILPLIVEAAAIANQQPIVRPISIEMFSLTLSIANRVLMTMKQ